MHLALHTFTVTELFNACVEKSRQVDVDSRPRLSSELCTKKGIESVLERQVWRPKEHLDVDTHMENAFDKHKITDKSVVHRTAFEALLQHLLEGDPDSDAAPTLHGVSLCAQI